MNKEDIEGLKAAGLNPIIIDENTEFKEEDYPIELNEKGRPKNTVKNKQAVQVRNKAAGRGWEYKLINYLKEIGYTNVCTTAGNSKNLDNQKVDIMNRDERKDGFLPFNLQAKNESKPIPYAQHLASMPQNGVPNVIAFKYTKKANTNFIAIGEYAIMDLKSWLYYLEIERKYKDLLSTLDKSIIGDLMRRQDEN